jgi:hypothetical protein
VMISARTGHDQDLKRSVPGTRWLSVIGRSAHLGAASGILVATHAGGGGKDRRAIEQPGSARCSQSLTEASSCSPAAGRHITRSLTGACFHARRQLAAGVDRVRRAE